MWSTTCSLQSPPTVDCLRYYLTGNLIIRRTTLTLIHQKKWYCLLFDAIMEETVLQWLWTMCITLYALCFMYGFMIMFLPVYTENLCVPVLPTIDYTFQFVKFKLPASNVSELCGWKLIRPLLPVLTDRTEYMLRPHSTYSEMIIYYY